MVVPASYIVETVDLTSNDALLPLFESLVNSIISLHQSNVVDKEIQIKIVRGDLPFQTNIENIPTIQSIIITDNGIGFNESNYRSFETPFSKTNKDFGCKGIGRFTVMAAFNSIKVRSNYMEGSVWKYREFSCDAENEIKPVTLELSENQEWKTTVELRDCFNPIIKDNTALSLEAISNEIMHHCLIYYLSDELPKITIFESEEKKGEIINELYQRVSKDNERVFKVGNQSFRAYITKVAKEGNRRNHYAYYCANSRVVGQPKNIGKINSLFNYPLLINGKPYLLEVYVVSEYFNKNVYKARNGFAIPLEKENQIFEFSNKISFEEIEEELVKILEEEYDDHVRDSKEKSQTELQNYIYDKAPRFRSLAKNKELLSTIPPNLPDDKKEEFLYKISFNARRNVEKNIQEFIDNKQITEESIEIIKNDLRDKTAYDVDSLADYMMRRKAIIRLFEKFLEADIDGKYKLEADIHNLIFPMGITNNDVDYETHNLWLLDERFLMYKFVASDKSITSMSQKKSSKEPDLLLLDENPLMFDNPIGFADKSNGDVGSMVIFEFKRPGNIAHQKNKTDYRWEFSLLVEPYFDDFLYSPDKKNYKGKQVILKKETPKFGYIIIDVIPPQLEQYNLDKGWNKTPFGSYYKMEPNKNMHLEVMTFTKLLEFATSRHSPFFDRLFSV
ncbi:hypothetical protein HYN48_07310 [Flavobacterium magnum]|uniref:ATP-binding protein n=1 Tax=Flavobacterium magnum TaxID=2162713 RepID=A0A2S0RFN8_9FLAO|nr:hypothetical protein [Flavobacterium magnum]AWA29901.1 hypothetical protein HYN48_07310 [Flavobacterium magnum]